MKKDFNSGLMYPDTVHFLNCGRIVEKKMVNLELQSDYSTHYKGKCSNCKVGYNVINKLFKGANGETMMGTFDSTGTMVMCSGVLTRNGILDTDLVARGNRAKNFQLKVALEKEKNKQKIVTSSYPQSP